MKLLVVIPEGMREPSVARLSHDGRASISQLAQRLSRELGLEKSLLFLHADRLPSLSTAQIVRRDFGRNIPMNSSIELGDRNDVPGTKEQIHEYLATRQNEAEIIFLILFQESVFEFARLFMGELRSCFKNIPIQPGQAFVIDIEERAIETI